MTIVGNLCIQRSFARFALVAMFFAAFAGVFAAAQTSGAGTITGTVADANEAVIPGAQVVVTNTDTGVVHEFTSNDAGIYTAPFLLPGHYTVDASANNFSKVKTTDITLLVGQVLTVNVTLKVNSTNTTVEVSGTAQILDVSKSEVSQVVDSQLVQNLPVNARNWS